MEESWSWVAQIQLTMSHPSLSCQSRSLPTGRSTWSGEKPGLLGLGGMGQSLISSVLAERSWKPGLLGLREKGLRVLTPESEGGRDWARAPV